MYYVYSDELYHHGVKGMKWGVRKQRFKKDNRQNRQKASNDIKKIETRKKNALKIAAIAGGAIAAGALIHAGRLYFANNIDSTIKAGTTLQRIDTSDTLDTGKSFYASLNKLDNLKFRWMLAPFRSNPKRLKLKSTDTIKIAANKNGLKAVQSLYDKDLNFRKYFHTRPDKRAYQKFNEGLPIEDDIIKNTFFDELKKMGYSGVRDANDVKNSFKAINPVIIFDSVNKIKQVSAKRISPAKRVIGLAVTNAYAKLPAAEAIAGTAAAINLYNAYKKKETNKK